MTDLVRRGFHGMKPFNYSDEHWTVIRDDDGKEIGRISILAGSPASIDWLDESRRSRRFARQLREPTTLTVTATVGKAVIP